MTCVHVGYPKTGSSTLQKHLFHRHPDITYLGIYPTANVGHAQGNIDEQALYLRNESLQRLHELLTKADEDDFSQAELQGLFQEHVQPYVSSSMGVLSNERFLSVFFSYPNLRAKARRLQHLVPDAQILITIRSQFESIVSQYRDWPFSPLNFTGGAPVSLCEWIEVALANDDSLRYIHSLKYKPTIEMYEELFGEDSVLVLCLETLAEAPSTFANRVSHFLKIDSTETARLLEDSHENRGVTKKRNLYRQWRRKCRVVRSIERRIPGFMKAKINRYLNTGKKASYQIPKDLKNKLRSIFRPHNVWLNNKRIPVEEHSYPGLE